MGKLEHVYVLNTSAGREGKSRGAGKRKRTFGCGWQVFLPLNPSNPHHLLLHRDLMPPLLAPIQLQPSTLGRDMGWEVVGSHLQFGSQGRAWTG